jgi:hypothetical protein
LLSTGNVTEYSVEQNAAISASVPGSWPPKLLAGNARTVKPAPRLSLWSCSSASYCGVSPHFERHVHHENHLPRMVREGPGGTVHLLELDVAESGHGLVLESVVVITRKDCTDGLTSSA